jgi:hypothetical protein
MRNEARAGHAVAGFRIAKMTFASRGAVGLVAALGLAACAQVNPDHAFHEVSDEVSARTGQSPRWARTDDATREADDRHVRVGLPHPADDFGHRFICYNRVQAQHVVLSSRYLKRNPHLAFSDAMEEVSKFGSDAKVFPISPDTTAADTIDFII